MKTVHSFMLYSASLLGQKVLEPTNPYGGQCEAYVSHLTRWATDNKYSLSYTNAIDLLARARANGFQVFYNDGKNQPQPGDIWVTKTYSHIYGHTGIFESVGGQPVTLEQNIDGNADALYNGGWVRRKNRLLYASGRMDYNPPIETQTLIGWFRLPLEGDSTSNGNAAINQKNRKRKSPMIGSFLFTVKETDHEFIKGAVYLYNAATNTVSGMHNSEELKYVQAWYKKTVGEDIPTETFSTQAPVHRRLFGGLQTQTNINAPTLTSIMSSIKAVASEAAKKTKEEITSELQALVDAAKAEELDKLSSAIKGNSIAKKKTFSASVALNIRDRASLSGAIVGRLNKGETVEIVGSANADKHYWISFLKDGKKVEKNTEEKCDLM
jgi:hypothetical protein